MRLHACLLSLLFLPAAAPAAELTAVPPAVPLAGPYASQRLLVLDADAGVHRRDRGTVLVRLGRLWEGAAEWERYLTRFPAAADADTFREQLRRVRQQLGSRN